MATKSNARKHKSRSRLDDEIPRMRPPTIYEEVIQALSEREMELEAALSAGFRVAGRLEALRSLLQRFRDIAAFATFAHGPPAKRQIAEIDRCTQEYERIVVKMGSLAAYGRAAALMAEFLPLDKAPAVETTRRRALEVGATAGPMGLWI